ncbi:unnamed protein product [Leptidea sinapis]|uniref:Uncharacterized protein n=1 Tax=Leptidea sinapis TaxID=189913 RepID=A0A5E4QZ23_9NEOP|nr:unnamed protein product [Leptidea sinapis]
MRIPKICFLLLMVFTVNSDQKIKLSNVLTRLNQSGTFLKIFGDFVASELRMIRSADHRKRLRHAIQKVILEMSDKDD